LHNQAIGAGIRKNKAEIVFQQSLFFYYCIDRWSLAHEE